MRQHFNENASNLANLSMLSSKHFTTDGACYSAILVTTAATLLATVATLLATVLRWLLQLLLWLLQLLVCLLQLLLWLLQLFLWLLQLLLWLLQLLLSMLQFWFVSYVLGCLYLDVERPMECGRSRSISSERGLTGTVFTAPPKSIRYCCSALLSAALIYCDDDHYLKYFPR